METSSSVYMCFPCYQEFETLDEVLKHQLTCNAEATEPAPIIPGTTSITVPLPQAQQQLVGQLVSPSRAVLTQQTKAEDTAVWPLKDATVQIESIKGSFSMSDQPRILYQCGDCNELFKSLDLWQEHRKEGSCQQPSSVQNTDDYPDNQPEADPEPQPESYCVQETAPEPEPEDSGSSKETFSENQDSIPLKEVTSSQVVTENQANVSSAENSGLPAAESINLVQDDSSPSRKRGANKKPKPEPVFLCVNCGSCFGLVSELVAHRKTQHGLEEALHRCSVCGECFLNTTLFLYHRKQHRQKGEERREATENVTETSGKVTETLERACAPEQDAEEKDVMIATPSSGTIFVQPELFMCIRCGESFSNGEGLAAHREGRHDLQAALHRCNTCGQDFMNTTQYLYHRRLHRSQAVTEDGEEAATEVDGGSGSTEDTQQTQKRPHSPPATSSDPDFPRPKRGRPAIRILSNSSSTKAKKGTGPGGISMEANSTATDSEATNQPPPAKLLQDWARTPLPHVCPYCGKTFTRRVFLRTHVFSHTGEKLFTCKVCSKCFTNSQSLLRHSMCHTGNKPYVCDVCGKKFSQVCTLKRHQGTHSSTQPRRKRGRKPICGVDDDGTAHVFSCPHCTARFNTEDQLKHHILLHSSHPFPCPECGEAFKRRKELDLHSLSHQDKEPVTCPHCSAQFINQSVLDIHLQRCPTSEEDKNVGRGRGQGRGRCTGQIECDLCGHRCMTQEGLDLHRLSHTGQTPLKCPVMSCRRRFASNGALEEHVVAHIQGTLTKAKHRPRFRCEICLKDFAYTSTFNVHMRTHTDERPFACATCGKRFRQLPHLQDHERIHSGLRPFCCWVCGKSFSVAARLTEHARTHSGEKPYVCGYCPAAFRSRSNLDKHARLHGELSQEDGEQHAAQVQQVLKGAKVLTSLAAAVEGEPGSVQTIYVLQEEDGDCGGTETVMISAEQLAAVDGSSQMVILPSSVLGGQTITVPTISMDGGEIMMQTNTSPHHTIEFIVEETVV